MTQLLDHRGLPIQKATLKQEVAAPSLLRMRSPYSPQVGELTPEFIAMALRHCEYGQRPERYLALAESMEERDLHYRSVLATRKMALCGREIIVEAASDRREDKKIAEFCRTIFCADEFADIIGGVQGQVLYRGAASWSALAVGTNGQVLTSGGTAANPSWSTVTGTGTVTSIGTGTGLTGGTITGAGTISVTGKLADIAGLTMAQGELLYYNGTNLTNLGVGTTGQLLKTNGAGANPSWTTVSGTGTVTSIVAGTGLTGGTITTTGTIALSTVTPALGGTGVVNNAASTITITGAFGTTFTVTGTTAVTLPTSGTLLSTAAVITPAQGGTGIANNASSTLTISGAFATTLTVTGTTGVTLPTTGTLATRAGTETLTNKTLTLPIVDNIKATQVADGTATTGTKTLDVSAGYSHKLTNGGAFTLAFSNWAATGILSAIEVELVNGAANTITWPTVNWTKGDGTYSTTFSSMGVTLRTTGTNTVLVWTTDGGTTLWGRVI